MIHYLLLQYCQLNESQCLHKCNLLKVKRYCFKENSASSNMHCCSWRVIPVHLASGFAIQSLQYFCLICCAMSDIPTTSTASAISDQLAGGLVRCSHTPSMAIRHLRGSPCSRSAIVFNSPSGISRKVPMGCHSLATVEYSSFIRSFLVGLGSPAEQKTII